MFLVISDSYSTEDIILSWLTGGKDSIGVSGELQIPQYTLKKIEISMKTHEYSTGKMQQLDGWDCAVFQSIAWVNRGDVGRIHDRDLNILSHFHTCANLWNSFKKAKPKKMSRATLKVNHPKTVILGGVREGAKLNFMMILHCMHCEKLKIKKNKIKTEICL